MQKHARVRRLVLGVSFVALAVLGVVRRPAAQGQFVNITIHMVAEPGLYGRVGAILSAPCATSTIRTASFSRTATSPRNARISSPPAPPCG